MAVIQSTIFEKAKKANGNTVYYRRIGVQMARSKPMPKENATYTTSQLKQQKVFRFFKANIDDSGVIALVNLCYDAKPQSGKSQTKYNMFYKSFMPHIVAQKEEIWALDEESLVNEGIFLGSDAENPDNLTKGILGAIEISSLSNQSATISAAALDAMIEKANSKLSSKSTPFTTDNLFMAAFGAGEDSGFMLKMPTKVAPTLSGDSYTINLTDLLEGFQTITGSGTVKTAYLIPIIGRSGDSSSFDTSERYFCCDSVAVANTNTPGA